MSRKQRSDAGTKRNPGQVDDIVFTFKLNPEDEIEGPIVKSIKSYRSTYNVGLREIIVDVFSRIEGRPPTNELVLLDMQKEMRTQIESLIEIIDRLVKSGGSLAPTAAAPDGSANNFNLSYVEAVKRSMKRGS